MDFLDRSLRETPTCAGILLREGAESNDVVTRRPIWGMARRGAVSIEEPGNDKICQLMLAPERPD